MLAICYTIPLHAPELSNKPLIISPNPATSHFILLNKPEQQLKISLYSADGVLVRNYDSDRLYSLDGIHPGIYIVKGEVNNSFYTGRISVAR